MSDETYSITDYYRPHKLGFVCMVGIGTLCGKPPVPCENHPCYQLFGSERKIRKHIRKDHELNPKKKAARYSERP